MKSKPKIYKQNGWWVCFCTIGYGLGLGSSPKKAYDNWINQQKTSLSKYGLS